MDLSRFPYLQGNYAPVLEEYDWDEGEGGLRVGNVFGVPVAAVFP